jgi:hypothetical protein
MMRLAGLKKGSIVWQAVNLTVDVNLEISGKLMKIHVSKLYIWLVVDLPL